MITQIVKTYDFSSAASVPADSGNVVFDPKFAIVFQAVPAGLDGVLATHCCGFSLAVSDKSLSPIHDERFNRTAQNYFSIKDPDGGCRVIEASLRMGTERRLYQVGFPLALLDNRTEEHEFAIMFDGIYFQILCDGIVMDRDCPIGRPTHIYQYPTACSHLSAELKNSRIINDLSTVKTGERTIRRDIPIQFYTPHGFNTWIGDVVPGFFGGRFHIFYLHDRRHHGSRRGKGAHEFWHVSSSDLCDWIDHGPVFELDEQWQSVGTGNVFEIDGKLHLSFGWHTERMREYPECANLLFHDNMRRLGHTGEFRYDEIGTLTPSGASYAVSEDGISFTQSKRLIHYLENPSIFVQPDGKLHLCQDGLWESDHLGGWRLIDAEFPPRAPNSFARNCLDCPTFFKLGGWEYFMVGFTGFWGRPDEPGAEWIDFVQRGWDLYDGANVPMTAPFRDGRLIEGSWLNGNGWGSCLVLREIIPLGGGRLGKRWIEETLPTFGGAKEFKTGTAVEPVGDTLLELTVNPGRDRLSILFSGEGNPCEFRLDLETGRAQWNAASGREAMLPTFREQALAHPEFTNFQQFADIPGKGCNFSQENLPGLDEPFLLRLLIHADPKKNALIIDAEIAGKRTMATQRLDLKATKAEVKFAYGKAQLISAKIRNGR